MKKVKKTDIQILLAGFGGQGIIFMGKMLAYIALLNDKKGISWMPSYGAEVRGGTAHSMVIISDKEIASPYVTEPDICVVMNHPSLKRFMPLIRKGGTLIIDNSLCEDKIERKDLKIIKIPATRLSRQIGNVKVANMICLGVLLKLLGMFNLKDAVSALDNLIPTHRKNLIPQNKKALIKGASYLNGKSKS